MDFKFFLENRIENTKTIQAYISDVENFNNFVQQNQIPMIEIQDYHIRMYHAYLTENGYSLSSIARKNSSLRAYFKFLRKKTGMMHNPMEDIEQPKIRKKNEILPVRILEDIKMKIKDSGEERDLLLVQLISENKLKLQETIEIRVEDFNEKQCILYLKDKAIPLNEEVIRLLKRVSENNNQGYVFRNKHGKKLSVSGAYYILSKYTDVPPNDLRKILL